MPKWGRKRPRKLIFLVGLYTVGYQLYDHIYPAITQNMREVKNLKATYGERTWVVVSGASNELGREFASHFSRKGFNLVLIDQNTEQLTKLQEDLVKETPDVYVQTIPFELKKVQTWQEYEQLCNQIKDITKDQGLSVLINNAEEFDTFGPKIYKAKDEDVLGTLTINTFPMVFMTRFLGPDMKLRKPNKSAIINVTSFYSEFNVPNAPIYSSSKAFEDVFSQILGYENQDMDVLTVKNLPYKCDKHPNGVDPKEIVEGVTKDLGYERISYGHWKHSLFRYIILWRQCNFWFGGNRGGACPVSPKFGGK